MANDIVPLPDMEKMAVAIARSGLFGVRTPDQALALMLVSQSEGRHPALAARDYDIIQGRPAKKAEAMQRDFLHAGGKIQWHELTDHAAKATFSHPQGGTATIEWDTVRVKQAGLDTKDNYKKFPRQMLRSRVVSEGVRTIYPAATSGMYVPEEVREFGPGITDTTDTIEATAETLDQFATAEETTTFPPLRNPFYQGSEVTEGEPGDLLHTARAAAIKGVLPFREFWKRDLTPAERADLKPHLAELEAAAKTADDPLGLEPTE